MIEKTKYYRFLEYIRNKREVFVDEHVAYTGLPLEPLIDRTQDIRQLVNGIRKVATIDDAYVKTYTLLMHYHKCNNPSWKEQPSLLFYEDVYEYFLTKGFTEEKAEEYTDAIANGMFEFNWERLYDYRKLFDADASMLKWAKHTKWLPHRSELAKLLPTEYDNFLHNHLKESCEFDESLGVRGNTLSSSRYLYNILQYDPESALDRPDNKLTVPCGILLLPSSFTDENKLYRVANEWFSTIGSELGGIARYRGNVLSVGRFCGHRSKIGIPIETKDHKTLTNIPNGVFIGTV